MGLIAQESADAPASELTQIQDLLLLGTSMGGARPKAVVGAMTPRQADYVEFRACPIL